jgi:hypothetical protein
MPLGQGGCFVSQVKKQKANRFDKNHPDSEFSLQTDLRDTLTGHAGQILTQEKFFDSEQETPRRVCMFLSIVAEFMAL